MLYTDWDLWGTKVTGPTELLARLEADEFLETAWLPDYRSRLDRAQAVGAAVEDLEAVSTANAHPTGSND